MPSSFYRPRLHQLRRGMLAVLALALLPTGAVAEELAGLWTLTIDTPRGVRNPTLEVVKDEAGAYSGTYNSVRGPIALDSISFDGSAFSFPMTLSMPIGEIEVSYRGTVSGDSMEGVAANPRGEVPFTGERSGP